MRCGQCIPGGRRGRLFQGAARCHLRVAARETSFESRGKYRSGYSHCSGVSGERDGVRSAGEVASPEPCLRLPSCLGVGLWGGKAAASGSASGILKTAHEVQGPLRSNVHLTLRSAPEEPRSVAEDSPDLSLGTSSAGAPLGVAAMSKEAAGRKCCTKPSTPCECACTRGPALPTDDAGACPSSTKAVSDLSTHRQGVVGGRSAPSATTLVAAYQGMIHFCWHRHGYDRGHWVGPRYSISPECHDARPTRVNGTWEPWSVPVLLPGQDDDLGPAATEWRRLQMGLPGV